MKIKKPFLIAEIGINHNGDIELAKKLILNAKNTGFDSVKFQKRTIDKVYSKEILDQERESPWGNTQRHQKEGLEFNQDQYLEIGMDAYSIANKILRYFEDNVIDFQSYNKNKKIDS